MKKPINPTPTPASLRPYTFDVAMKEAAKKARAVQPPIYSITGGRRA